MSPRRAMLALVCAGVAAVPAGAQDHGGHGGADDGAPEAALIAIRTSEVTPRRLAVLPGETVKWQNQSLRDHTVTSRDGLFDVRLSSGRVTSHAFPAIGEYGYFCRLHPNITGTVAVRPVLLAGPDAAVVRGEEVELSGRTAPGAGEAIIARDGAEVGRVSVAASGAFAARVRADADGEYTASVRGDRSDSVRLTIVDRRTVTARRRGNHIDVRVTPAVKGATIVLQLRLKERFGWWPTRVSRTDAAGRATLRVPRRRAPARVVLMAADGATVLASTAVMKLAHKH